MIVQSFESGHPYTPIFARYVHAQSQEPDGATYFLSGISATPEVLYQSQQLSILLPLVDSLSWAAD